MNARKKKRTRPDPSSTGARRRMQATRRRDTPCELALRSWLHRLGMRFRVDWPVPGTRRRADVALVASRVAIFVDGCFWHGCPIHGTWPKSNAEWWRRKLQTNVARDRDTDARLTALGWQVFRVWEHEDSAKAAMRLATSLKRRKGRCDRLRLHRASR
ncbi:MAG: DNA mismatch endonuclease Vsr [Acidobacteriota bacterium]